jgi:hypothetical protein
MGRAHVIQVYEEEKPANKTIWKSAKVCSVRPMENPRFWLYTSLSSLTWSSAEHLLKTQPLLLKEELYGRKTSLLRTCGGSG